MPNTQNRPLPQPPHIFITTFAIIVGNSCKAAELFQIEYIFQPKKFYLFFFSQNSKFKDLTKKSTSKSGIHMPQHCHMLYLVYCGNYLSYCQKIHKSLIRTWQPDLTWLSHLVKQVKDSHVISGMVRWTGLQLKIYFIIQFPARRNILLSMRSFK